MRLLVQSLPGSAQQENEQEKQMRTLVYVASENSNLTAVFYHKLSITFYSNLFRLHKENQQSAVWHTKQY